MFCRHCVLYGIIFQMLFCAPSYGSKDDNETRHNNCVSWHEDSNAIILTCRVRNFVLPVTFVHTDSKTRVVCHINGTEQCNPREKKITINRHNTTVTIVLEEKKFEKNHDGEWLCKQGQSIQSTKVSTSQGVIIDSWVLLRGITSKSRNGSKYINLECSSCRKPNRLYAEFLVNGKTSGSVLQDNNGDCIYKQLPCKPNKCSCSQTGNMYLFRLGVNKSNTPVNYSCDMHFKDQYRNGIFSITARTTYIGKDFSVIEHDTDIIKNNTNIVVHKPGKSTRKPGTNEPIFTTVRSTNNGKQTEKEPRNVIPAIVISISVVCVLGLVSIFVWYCKCRQPDRNNTQSITYTKDSDEAYHLLSADHENDKYPVDVKCKTCEKEQVTTQAVFLCFDCRQYYCENCFNMHGKMDILSFHKHVKVELIPNSFNISILSCSLPNHEAAQIEYICKNHDELSCINCKHMKHSNCKMTVLKDYPKHLIIKLISEVMSEHNSLMERLSSNGTFLQNGLKIFNMQWAFMKCQKESSACNNTILPENKTKEADDQTHETIEDIGDIETDNSEKTGNILGKGNYLHHNVDKEEEFEQTGEKYIAKTLEDIETENSERTRNSLDKDIFLHHNIDKEKEIEQTCEKYISKTLEGIEDIVPHNSERTQNILTKGNLLQHDIDNQKKVFEFLSEYGGPSCLVIAGKLFCKKLSEKKREIEINEQTTYILEFKHKTQNKSIAYKRKYLPHIRISTEKNNVFSKCTGILRK